MCVLKAESEIPYTSSGVSKKNNNCVFFKEVYYVNRGYIYLIVSVMFQNLGTIIFSFGFSE